MGLQANALTDYETVAARLRLTGGADRTLIEQLINEASDQIERETHRKLTYNGAENEWLPGRGDFKLLLSRTPLVGIPQSPTINGVAVDSTSFSVHDADAGILFRAAGWPWSAGLRPDLGQFTLDQEPGTERKNINVVYSGGFITGPQASGQVGGVTYPGNTTSVAAGRLFKDANSPAQLWRCSTAGTTGTGTTFPSGAAQGDTAADGSVTWTCLGTAGAAGSKGTAASIPSDLERATVLAVVSGYYGDNRDGRLVHESVLGGSQTWAPGSAFPPEVQAIVNRYAREL